ncbi:Uncharacterized conserved protein YbjT, contains NAD(P)-binding and DUF2867 domains [Cupriavidus sp. YR651]|uniref:NmrA/HSCARG family protein n=1 Tax=Cupriavidus sp. YR651 TaxID=1855315 RepID=UPI00087F4DE0|nr:NmrA/HSCARG family protein [Cupriavidus sp. YR651]SDC92455.1 Uncharacterized conserved protein YbjT, contains NAD(P)-binding and DUF2867 domains [Cupriavidus sp. YR651]
MPLNTKRVIAVIGATGQQGSAVVRALKARDKFKVRALTREPGKHRDLADEVVEADLDRPETLLPALDGAYGLFLVTNFWQEGTDELKQAKAAIAAARDAGVEHLVWSTLPDVEAISGGRFNVPHYTGKARIDRIVREAGFAYYTYVVPPFYYQNLLGVMAPQKQPDGSLGWSLPLNPDARGIHMGDINELGDIVAGAFAHPDEAGHGEYLPLVGDLMSFNDIIATLRQLGLHFSFNRVPAGVFPAEVEATFDYFEAHTYMGSHLSDEIARAKRIAGRQPTPFLQWARERFQAA